MSEINLTAPHSPRHELRIWLIPPLLTGLWLRSIGLRAQILTGDELHTVHGALTMPVSEIIRTWTFGGADYCVPLTALFRSLMDQGVTLSELSFRAPSLVTGLAAIVLLPWLARPRIGRHAAIAFAWLLALSPMLVFYSRIVRSYMPAVLAAGIAVLLFDHWLRERRGAAALGYVVWGAVAVYLHLGAAPLVLAPLLSAAWHSARRSAPPREWLAGLWPGLAVACIVAMLLLPAQESLQEVLRDKRGGELPPLDSWLGVLRLQLGTRSWAIGALALGLVARGSVVLWRRDRDFALYLASLLASQIVGLLVLSPDRLEERSILNRYLLVCLPLVLILLAAGLATPWRRRRAEPAAPAADWSTLGISIAALFALFATGPLAPGSHYWTSPFAHALTSIDFLGNGNWIPADATPPFYHSIAREPGATARDTTLIEYPWQNLSSHAFDAYQRTHGLPVIVSSVIDRSHEERVVFHNRSEPTEPGFLASRARYLVVHKNLRQEAGNIVSSDIHLPYWLGASTTLWDPLRRAARVLSSELERSWGAPSYEDEALRVWDLEQVRRQLRGPEGA